MKQNSDQITVEGIGGSTDVMDRVGTALYIQMCKRLFGDHVVWGCMECRQIVVAPGAYDPIWVEECEDHRAD